MIDKNEWEFVLNDAIAYLKTKPLERTKLTKNSSVFKQYSNQGYELAIRTLEKFRDEGYDGDQK